MCNKITGDSATDHHCDSATDHHCTQNQIVTTLLHIHAHIHSLAVMGLSSSWSPPPQRPHGHWMVSNRTEALHSDLVDHVMGDGQ